MYIAPNTTIHILHNVPLNKSYENTVYYADASTQATAFLAYNKYTLNNYSYQRAQLGTIRVELPYENLYDCNYLMFKNTNFENKWFYCFITGIAYINNAVTEIYYEMDVMQTWCYDYHFLDTFVERRHSEKDELYENTQPEGLDIGSVYGVADAWFFPLTREMGDHQGIPEQESGQTATRMWYVLLTTQEITGGGDANKSTYGVCANVFTGLWIYSSKNPSEIASLIQAANNQGQDAAIVSFYMSPCDPRTQYSTTDYEHPNIEYEHHEVNVPRPNQLYLAYKPVNKKLFSFPFTKVRLTNNSGLETSFHPEYFGYRLTDPNWKEDKFQFIVELSGFPTPMAKAYARNYQTNSLNENSLIYGNFPTCAFSGNTFQMWWAQNKNNYIATMNAIQNNYDTNRAIAQNNYNMASRTANASAAMANASNSTSLANATASNNTALDNARTSAAVGIAGNAIGAVGNALTLDFGGAIDNVTSAINTGVQWSNTQNTLATQLSNANATASTAAANTQLGLSTALKNAATSQTNAELSALTNKTNAVNALVAKKQDMENVPNSARGNAQCDAMNYTDLSAGFYFFVETVRPEYAERIDNYFTCYGYAQNALFKGTDLDKRINRPHYTFLRTVGAAITGALNQADATAIQEIYNNGITTWDTLEDVGNYQLDNKPEE